MPTLIQTTHSTSTFDKTPRHVFNKYINHQMSSPMVDGEVRTAVEERTDEQGRKFRITRRIRMRKIMEKVPLMVAERHRWAKYGDSANDKPGPNMYTTMVGEEVFLNLALDRNFEKEAANKPATSPIAEAKSIVCRYCKGAHWTAKCPYKETFKAAAIQEQPAEETAGNKDKGGKYVPPSLREAQADEARGASATIRLSNLEEITTELDIRNLCSSFGSLQRVFVVKDYKTGKCKGSSFVTFDLAKDAEKALARLNGHRYGNLILKAELSLN
jgi:translation initiation factor 3 subunit G